MFVKTLFLGIVIFCCANATAFHMSDWKISEGSLGSITVSCKMGRCFKRVENHWFRVYVLGVRL